MKKIFYLSCVVTLAGSLAHGSQAAPPSEKEKARMAAGRQDIKDITIFGKTPREMQSSGLETELRYQELVKEYRGLEEENKLYAQAQTDHLHDEPVTSAKIERFKKAALLAVKEELASFTRLQENSMKLQDRAQYYWNNAGECIKASPYQQECASMQELHKKISALSATSTALYDDQTIRALIDKHKEKNRAAMAYLSRRLIPNVYHRITCRTYGCTHDGCKSWYLQTKLDDISDGTNDWTIEAGMQQARGLLSCKQPSSKVREDEISESDSSDENSE